MGTGCYVKLTLAGGNTRYVKRGHPEHYFHAEVIDHTGKVRCFILEEMDKAFEHYYKCCERFRKAWNTKNKDK